MEAGTTTRKRVRFGAVTYVSPPRPEETQDMDLRSHRCDCSGADEGGSDVETLLGAGEGGGPRHTQRATLLLCSTISAARGVSPVTVDVEDDEAHSTPATVWAESPARACAPSSSPQPPCPRDEMPSDEATYDTPQECATAVARVGRDVHPSPPRREGAELSGASPTPRGGSPTLSQLLAAVDDVLGDGDSQRTARSPESVLLPSNTDGRTSLSLTQQPPQTSSRESVSIPPCPASETASAAPCDSVPPPAHEDTAAAVTVAPAPTAAPLEANAAPCVFCGAGAGTASPHPAQPLCATDGVAYHMACALWCPEVYYELERGALQGIRAAAARAHGIKCALCRRPGAAVGCACPTCPLSFHVPCAVQAHASVDVETFVLYCPAHRPPRDGSR